MSEMGREASNGAGKRDAQGEQRDGGVDPRTDPSAAQLEGAEEKLAVLQEEDRCL